MNAKHLFAAAMLLIAATPRAQERPEPIRLIVETDMGNDIDDALALDLIYKAADAGRVELLGISNHKQSDYASEYIDILNTWYGYPDIPVAKSAVCIAPPKTGDYCKPVCEMTRDGHPAFLRSKNAKEVTESVTLYRRLLAAQPDSSVTVLSLGFGTALAHLLESGPDAFSDLTGRELVARKVCLLSIMAGSYGDKIRAEYNVVNDIPAMQRVFAEWDTPIVQGPFELGKMVLYPGSAIENDFGWAPLHPVVEGYKSYGAMPYDRPTWDLLSFVWLTHPEFFTPGEQGRISIDDQGYTHFTPDPAGRHTWITATPEQAETMKAYIVAETTRPPKRYTR